MTHGLDELNALPVDAFVSVLDGIFERAPWVAASVAPQRPFETVTALHNALMEAVGRAPEADRLAFLRSHPALSRSAAGLTKESQAEQEGVSLGGLDGDYADFERTSCAYEQKFGFPFLICVRRHTARSILRHLRRRIGNDAAREKATAYAEIGLITRLRLSERVTGPGAPVTTGHLSTHVLDTARGRPATGIRIELFREGTKLHESVTNDDGRTAEPLIHGEPLRIGAYELRFELGGYFPDAEWHDVIPVRFNVTEPEGRYHIPLLVTPWSYSTYRGS